MLADVAFRTLILMMCCMSLGMFAWGVYDVLQLMVYRKTREAIRDSRGEEDGRE